MKVSRTISYAIVAMLQLARESAGVPVSCSQLTRTGQLPKRFLLQILRQLVGHGVLRSTRGADGGYYLSRPPQQITLRDIFDAFDNPVDIELPTFPGFSSSARGHVIRVLQNMREAGRAELAKLSLADLIRPSGGGRMDE
ncbi:MAG TPA: Rrf2 family transcriptional regulator [Bradyrhizobium sp.]|nr:Rrf2 family transcriptional regulator [Bradyrhizobium sp.]